MRKNDTINETEILSRDEYKTKRKILKKKMLKKKKNRRLDIGPYITIYFENRDTILHQINEMVYIENGGKEQIKEEISAYKSLIPNGKELVATLMVEIDSPVKRADFLGKMGGFEENLDLTINNIVIKGNPESDVERTTAEGKASSVQFVHFDFDDDAINEFKNTNQDIMITINHNNYKHSTIMSKETKDELSKDF